MVHHFKQVARVVDWGFPLPSSPFILAGSSLTYCPPHGRKSYFPHILHLSTHDWTLLVSTPDLAHTLLLLDRLKQEC